MGRKLLKTAKWACTAACALSGAALALNAFGYGFGWTAGDATGGAGIEHGSIGITYSVEFDAPMHGPARGFFWYGGGHPPELDWWQWRAYRWGFCMPLWTLGATAGLPAAWLWRCDLRARPRPGRCPSCGYSLAGLAEGSKCPECGKT